MKTGLTITLFVSMMLSAWGQGSVDLRTGAIPFATPADRAGYQDYVAGTKLVGTEYVAALWFVPGVDFAGVDGRISPDRGRQTGAPATFRPPTTALKGFWVHPAGVSP